MWNGAWHLWFLNRRGKFSLTEIGITVIFIGKFRLPFNNHRGFSSRDQQAISLDIKHCEEANDYIHSQLQPPWHRSAERAAVAAGGSPASGR